MKGDNTNDTKASTSRSSSNNNNQNGKLHQNTVFIHKLYNILQDDNMKELIWWSDDGISFHIKPNEKFSKALATYFKHTNITSFVRQLNIYGFHKVNNIIDTSVLEHTNYETPTNHISKNDSTKDSSTKQEEPVKIWEFKHSANLFRKGDLESLKLIKRRSSTKTINSLNNANNSASVRKNSNASNSNTSISSMNGGHISRNGSNNATTYNNIPTGRLTPTSLQQQILENNAYNESRNRFASTQSDQLPNFYPMNQPQLLPNNGINVNIVGQQFRSTDSLQTLNARNPYNGLDSNTSDKYKDQDLLEQLKATNFDMIKLIDLVEKFVSVSSKFTSSPGTNNNHPNSNPGSRSNSNNHGLSEHDIIQNDILALRQDIVNRWNENLHIYQADLQAGQYMTSTNPIILQQQSQQPQQPQQVVPVIYRQTPLGVSQQVIGYNAYAQVPLTQQQMQQQHLVQTNQPVTVAAYPSNVTFTNENMMNPFEVRNHSRNELQHNKRNMSVLVDPLTPATSTHNSAVNFIPPVVRPIPMSKTVMQRGSSVSSVSIASVIDPHRRTPESLLRESMTINNNGVIVNSNGTSVNKNNNPRVVTSLTDINEEYSKRGDVVNQYPNQQSITPQSSISMGKNDKGYVDLQNQNSNSTENLQDKDKSPVNNIPQDYKVRSILNDTKVEGNRSDEHVDKKIKTAN
ncbi:flocculation suppression protein [Monosporozyma unispora]|nr:hypothetical protein C6P44_003791 [Kazachstania unispora]